MYLPAVVIFFFFFGFNNLSLNNWVAWSVGSYPFPMNELPIYLPQCGGQGKAKAAKAQAKTKAKAANRHELRQEGSMLNDDGW